MCERRDGEMGGERKKYGFGLRKNGDERKEK
jgi:hypothetical protein